MALLPEYENYIAALDPELRRRECALIELGRESARRFDDGHDPAGSRVRLVLGELRKLADRWDRLTLPAPVAPDPEPEVSELDQFRAKWAREMGGSAG